MLQKQSFYKVLALSLLIFQISCKQHIPVDLSQEVIFPKPVSLQATQSSFELDAKTEVFVQSEALNRMGQYLVEKINPATGFVLSVQIAAEEPSAGIYLTLGGAEDLGEEGYALNITETLVKLEANKPAGLFRGIQTLRQILPAKIESGTVQEGPWLMGTGTIRDYPEYAYRGVMLDVARHFFGVEDVKKYLDQLAFYKINYLHLHLSDDQGWRIEIKSWPNLTEHGGSTQVGGEGGGFYTQDQYQDLVQYAADRFITIVPEIDMPGHTNAALSSYAELNCNGKATELYTGMEVGFSTFCTDKEITYKFIDDVVREIAALTPGPYFHLGGDESHATPLKDYIPFVNKVQEIVAAHGKLVIGWDEISHATLKPNTFVQYWDNATNATNAVKQGAKVLVSPAKKAYLDMQYDSTTKLGLHWAAYVEVDIAYNWDPAKLIPGMDKQNIIGVEAPLWTETITTLDEIEYMVYPRLVGISEVAWTPSSSRSWEDYKVRLGKHGKRMGLMGLDYYPSKLIPWEN